MPAGIVYILVNEAMPGLTKIGKTASAIEERMKALDTTGVPLPFECFHASKVLDIEFVEKQLHHAFNDVRIRQRREFFRVLPEQVRAALILAEVEDVTPRDDIVEDADDQAALNEARARRPPYSFHLVDIPVGSVLHFTRDPEITATVTGNRRIEFEGEVTSLSAAANVALQRQGINWGSVQGPSYWTFDGETLDDRRLRMEEEDD